MEIASQWRVYDSKHTGERERHSTPQIAVVELVAGEEAVFAATLQNVGKLCQNDGEVGHGCCPHVEQAAWVDMFGREAAAPVVEEVIAKSECADEHAAPQQV